jgi:hypothetical protein
MQSYNGTIRFFPNWPKKQDASFHTLRAAGAFLVSAELRNGIVIHVRIMSEKGNDLHMLSPWKQPVALIRGNKKTVVKSTEIYLKTSPGEVIVFSLIKKMAPLSCRSSLAGFFGSILLTNITDPPSAPHPKHLKTLFSTGDHKLKS